MTLPVVAWMVGCPQSGKTSLAKHSARVAHLNRGWPVLIVDSAEVHNLADVPLHSTEDAIEALWREPRGHARVVPRDIEEMDRLMRAVRAGKRVVVVVDEAHFWLSAQSGVSGELVKLMRATQHAQVDLILTTQHLTGDVPQSALSCTTDLYVFRCTAPRVLQTLDREYGLEREQVRNLPQFHFLHVSTGF